MRRMVMTLLAVALVLAIGANVDARIKAGPKLGGAITTISGDVLEQLDSKTSIDLGAFVQVPLGSNSPVVIQPEVLYVMKGGKFSESGFEVSYNFDYIEFPILVKYNIPTNGKLTPNFFAGPVVGLLSSAKIKAEFDGESDEEDIKDFFKSTDFSLAFGGGLDVMMGNSGTLTFDLRYEIGLTNTFDEADGEGEEIKHNALMLNVGWGFNL